MARDAVVQQHDAALQWFADKLRASADAAENALLAQLSQQLDVDGEGHVVRSGANRSVLRRTSRLIERALRVAGYTAVAAAFVRGFGKQPGLFIKSLQRDGFPDVVFGSRDVAALVEQQAALAKVLNQPKLDLVSGIGRTIALLGAGFTLASLIAAVKQAFKTFVRFALEASITSLSTFFRTVAGRGYEILAGLFDKELRFEYIGPLDERNRPKCHEWKTADRQWTKAEIAELRNGYEQYGYGDVMIHGGGPACRHFWRAIAWASLQTSE